VILNQLVLHNVGTFADRHVIDLTPPSRTKPIILIGGLNGAGKTTILESIQLALYGSLAHGTGRRRTGSYDNYLRGLIHRGVPHSEGAAIELTFQAHQEGVEHTYWVRRSWKSTGASIREILLVSVDGRHHQALTSTWNEQVETFLPRGIAGLFFFDGEQIEALADMDRSREVLSSALAALLGLDLVERLTTDLGVLRRRHRSKQVPDSLREGVEERQRTVTALRQGVEAARNAAASYRTNLEQAQKQLHDLTERYRDAGGDLLDQREAAETAATMLRADLVRCEDEIRQELGEASPLLQLGDLLVATAAQVEKEASAARERVVADVFAARDTVLLEQLRAVKLRAAALDQITDFLNQDREQRRVSSEVDEIVGLHDTGAFESLIGSALPTAGKRLQALVDRRTNLQVELDQAERVLAAIPDPEALAPLRAKRESASDAVIRIDASLHHATEQLDALTNDRLKAEAAYEAALDKAAQANLAADDDRRLIEHVDRVRTTLEQLRLSATRRHLERISLLILEALGMLLRKDKLVTEVRIDAESHTVTLTGVDGQPLPAQALSAGERQLLAVALLWGLARAAGQPLPVIIDTPLGRLDGSHRQHLLERYFPQASHQVVLLSTDTEINEEAYERISPYIGRAYRLEFDKATNASYVEAGYFWE
jgi:DNA sulfur modification protein DndD